MGGNPAAGNSAVGGSSAGAAATGGAPGLDPAGFTLLYRDDFNSLDMNRWQLMTHSWESNLALFSANTVTATDGFLTLRLMDAPAGTVDDTGASKPYLGAEVRSRDTLTYGRVRTRAKLARGAAVVSALVTIYTPWPADNWNELDIECLGAEPNNVQFNAMVYTGPPPPMPLTASVTPTQDPLKVDLGFDPSADFHVFTMEWTPEAANFYVDDVLLRSWTQNIDLLVLPQNVLMTIWASSAVEWAGAVTAETNTASVVYDWIELYEYAAP